MNGPARAIEPALDPDLPIVDAHHHLWPEPPAPGVGTYLPEELTADVAGCGHRIESTVFVEAFARYRTNGPAHLATAGETEFANAVGDAAMGGPAEGVCSAIVACADMSLGAAVQEVLDEHLAAAPQRLRGIRYLVACDAEYIDVGTRPAMLAEPKFREAFARLAPNDLSYDAWVFHPQLDGVIDLAAAFPETRIVLDHIGSPVRVGRFAGREAEVDAVWLAAMRRLAAHANVFVKIGGLNGHFTGLGPTGAQGGYRSSDDLVLAQRRHVLETIEAFGVDRCMFESNFPVDRDAAPADVLWNGFKKIVSDFSLDERRRLFAGTASEVYRLGH